MPASPARPAGGVRVSRQQRRADAQVQRLQHGLVVLVLVADHQAVDEVVLRFVGEPIERIERSRSHRPAVAARLMRGQQRQVGAAGAGVHEGVVEAFHRAGQDSRPIRVAAAQQPQFFLLADMRQVPDQRAHQRVVLTTQFRVVEIDQPQRSSPRPVHVADQRFA